MPNDTLEPFVFSLPKSIPLEITSDIQKMGSISFTSTKFLERLKQIANDPTLDFITKEDRLLLTTCFEKPIKKLPKGDLIKLINIVLQVRNQIIVNNQGDNLAKQKPKIECLQEATLRVKFIKDLIEAIGVPAFESDLSSFFEQLILALLYDMEHISSNISEGFYKQYFTKKHQALTKCFEDIQSLQNIILEFMDGKAISVSTHTLMCACLIPYSLYNLMFSFAIGDIKNTKISSHFTSYFKRQIKYDKDHTFLNEISNDICRKTLVVQQEIKNNTKQKLLSDLLNDLTTSHKTHISVMPLTAATELNGDLEKFHTQLEPIKELNLDSYKLISEGMFLLHCTHIAEYHNNQNTIRACQKILERLQKILPSPDSGNIIAKRIHTSLEIYFNKIDHLSVVASLSLTHSQPSSLPQNQITPDENPSASGETKMDYISDFNTRDQLWKIQSSITILESKIRLLKEALLVKQQKHEDTLSKKQNEQERADKEIISLTEELGKLEKQLNQEKETLQKNQTQIEFLKTQVQEKNNKQKAAQKERSIIDKDLKNLLEAHPGLLKQVELLPTSIISYEETIQALMQAIQEEERVLQQYRTESNLAKKELETALATKAILEGEINTLQDLTTEKIRLLTTEITTLEKTSEQLQTDNNTLYELIQEQQSELNEVHQAQIATDRANKDIFANRVEAVTNLYSQPLQSVFQPPLPKQPLALPNKTGKVHRKPVKQS